jgi:hypothetical protein
MPVVIAWIGEMLLSVVGQLAFSVLVSLGIAMVANTAASGLIDHTQIGNAFAASGLTQWIGFFGVDKGMTIVLSAWAGRKITDAARLHFTAKQKASS